MKHFTSMYELGREHLQPHLSLPLYLSQKLQRATKLLDYQLNLSNMSLLLPMTAYVVNVCKTLKSVV